IKNVQVDSEIALRESTGLILGQWLSIPFIIWGIWLIVAALRRPAEQADTPRQSEMAKHYRQKKK
ncbi:MAG TPA: prolipoprotein diacylglyceryl transferase, partial [Porphyromonadaceae bacterium]|nr:prolipoprotein diacylglyceryl transferase [Porphyromonadaceae bacterium]